VLDNTIYNDTALIGEASGDLVILDEDGAYLQYCGYSPALSKKFLSPFQKENNPSFYFYRATNPRFDYYYVCYSTGNKGDLITLCTQLFNDTYGEAVNRLIRDGFAKGDYINSKSVTSIPRKLPNKNPNQYKKNTDIKVVTRDFSKIDIEYWNQYGLDTAFLEKHNVKPCTEVWFNKDGNWRIWIKGDNIPVYRYLFGDRYKIYNPTNYKNVGNWLSNVHGEIIQGLQYLPKDGGELLIITKSYKDVLLLRKTFDIDSIAFQSEQIIPRSEIVNYFLDKYAYVYLLYDNDIPGKNASDRFIAKYPTITNIMVPEESGSKDISDYYRDYGKDEFEKLIIKMLN
jgi:hypothetical protein